MRCKDAPQRCERHYVYVVTETIEGQTLARWMTDHPCLTLQTVRGIVEQIARGLQAFYRLEMLHQDLQPHSVMIEQTGTVKIINFGATRVAGVLATAAATHARSSILGAAQFTAPGYFLGLEGTACSDLFSLGVVTHQMLSGRLPAAVWRR